MASNYTPRLGLSTWSAEDDFTMAEFNQNHQRLEERLGYLARSTIFESSFADSATIIEIPLTMIDWAKYTYVYIDHTIHANTNSIYTRLNGNSSSAQLNVYTEISNGTVYDSTGYISIDPYDARNSLVRLRFNVMRDPQRSVSMDIQNHKYNAFGTYSSIGYADLVKLSISPSSSSGVIRAGGTVRIWGV